MNPYEAALRALLPHVIAIRQRPDNTPEFTRAVDHAVSLFGPKAAPQEPNPILQFAYPNNQPKETP